MKRSSLGGAAGGRLGAVVFDARGWYWRRVACAALGGECTRADRFVGGGYDKSAGPAACDPHAIARAAESAVARFIATGTTVAADDRGQRAETAELARWLGDPLPS